MYLDPDKHSSMKLKQFYYQVGLYCYLSYNRCIQDKYLMTCLIFNVHQQFQCQVMVLGYVKWFQCQVIVLGYVKVLGQKLLQTFICM